MKKFILTIVCSLMTLGIMAQSEADKILGTYRAVQAGNVSKVKISKKGDGYTAQVIWLEKPNNPDGTKKLDHKNPDAAKQKTPADQIVLIDKVVYKDGMWKDGKIYDPTKGKTFKVEIIFKDAKTLRVRGFLGPFYETVYWTKL